jgi:hypothetical protein
MTIIILILAYILYIDDILSIISQNDSNILVSGSLVTLLSWSISTPWGIVMCVISSVLLFIALANRL